MQPSIGLSGQYEAFETTFQKIKGTFLLGLFAKLMLEANIVIWIRTRKHVFRPATEKLFFCMALIRECFARNALKKLWCNLLEFKRWNYGMAARQMFYRLVLIAEIFMSFIKPKNLFKLFFLYRSTSNISGSSARCFARQRARCLDCLELVTCLHKGGDFDSISKLVYRKSTSRDTAHPQS